MAIAKSTQEQQLRQALNAQKEQQHSQQEQVLANQIRETHAEFLADIEKNSAKSAFLKLACAANVINSPEDMQVFATEYTNLEKAIKEQVRQEIEAEKAIAEAENKAQIPNGSSGYVAGGDKAPSYADIEKMSQAQFNAAVDKYGLEKILNAK